MSTEVLIEVVEKSTSNRQVRKLSEREFEALSQARPIVEAAVQQGVEIALSSAAKHENVGPWRLSEIELSFGVKVASEAGIIVSSVSGEASLEVTIRATRSGT